MDFCQDPPQSFFTPVSTQAANRKAGAGPLHRRHSVEPTCSPGTETEARSCLREQAEDSTQPGRGLCPCVSHRRDVTASLSEVKRI